MRAAGTLRQSAPSVLLAPYQKKRTYLRRTFVREASPQRYSNEDSRLSPLLYWVLTDRFSQRLYNLWRARFGGGNKQVKQPTTVYSLESPQPEDFMKIGTS